MSQVDAVAIDEGGIGVFDLRGGMVNIKPRIGADAGIAACVGELFPQGGQLLVILPEHKHIQVIVPGNKALVPGGSQAGSAGQNKGKMVLLAERLKIEQNLQQLPLYLADFHAVAHLLQRKQLPSVYTHFTKPSVLTAEKRDNYTPYGFILQPLLKIYDLF